MAGTIIKNTSNRKRKQIIANRQSKTHTCRFCGTPTSRRDRDCGRCTDPWDTLPIHISTAFTRLADHPDWYDGYAFDFTNEENEQ